MQSVVIIAEVAQAHDGSLGTAHAFIDAIATAGADAVKFQTHIAAEESTPGEPWRVKFSLQDTTRYDYWKRMEFTEEQWHGLKAHASDRGLQFISSPFSIEAAELLIRVGVSAWKIASGEVNNIPLLDRLVLTGLPILLSSGMSWQHELDAAVQKIIKFGCDLTVLQCTSMYPTPPEKLGLNLIQEFRERYGCKVGLSDHSGTIYAGLAAAALGADALEVHVTLSRDSFGPDVPSSVTIEELRHLVQGIRFIEKARVQVLRKDDMAKEVSPLRDFFTKSAVAKADLAAGTLLEERHVALKKPGTGIPASHIKDLIGRRLRHEIKADTLLLDEYFD